MKAQYAHNLGVYSPHNREDDDMNKMGLGEVLKQALSGGKVKVSMSSHEVNPLEIMLAKAMQSGIDHNGKDELRDLILGGINDDGSFNLFDDEGHSIEDMADATKPLSHLVLAADLRAEKERAATTLRDLVMSYHMAQALRTRLAEQNGEVKRLQGVEEELKQVTKERDLAIESVHGSMTDADFEAGRGHELRAVVYGLALAFDGSGKGKVLAAEIMEAVTAYDSAERPMPEGADDSHVVDHDADTHGTVDA